MESKLIQKISQSFPQPPHKGNLEFPKLEPVKIICPECGGDGFDEDYGECLNCYGWGYWYSLVEVYK